MLWIDNVEFFVIFFYSLCITTELYAYAIQRRNQSTFDICCFLFCRKIREILNRDRLYCVYFADASTSFWFSVFDSRVELLIREAWERMNKMHAWENQFWDCHYASRFSYCELFSTKLAVFLKGLTYRCSCNTAAHAHKLTHVIRHASYMYLIIDQ